MNRTLLNTVFGFAAALVMFFAFSLHTNAENTDVQITAKNGQQLTLNQQSFYVDSSLSASDPASFKFKTIHEAVASSVDGTEAQPMVIYIEPDVYQMNGTLTDRGLYIDRDWVSLIGLATDAQDVVLADNRGHTIGAQGPNGSGSSPAETIYVRGTGFHAENLTIGNYCNVDLVYPKDPSKNQPKRSSTITQAYVIGASNPNKALDKFTFKNVRFVSMLDTTNLNAVKRSYFMDSYLQGTDDYMGGGDVQVMKNTTLHLYSSKPVFSAGKNGMGFINCTWEVEFADPQDLTIAKNSSTLYLINNEFKDLTGNLTSIQWAPYPGSNIMSYAYGIKLNGQPYTILPEANGIQLTDEQLKAYSAYSMLKGTDDWDPANEKAQYGAYGDLPMNIAVTKNAEIRTGEVGAKLTASVYPAAASQHITWSVDSDKAVLDSNTGNSITVTGNNTGEQAVDVIVTATADNGITNQSIVTVSPSFIDPPVLTKAPSITEPKDGKVTLDYSLNLSYDGGTRTDQSLITWYRVDDANGTNPIQVAVSQPDQPLTAYTLTTGDAGHYLQASISPKHPRSHAGEAVTAVSTRIITMSDVAGTGTAKFNYTTSFENFPTAWQPQLIDGTWTVDAYYPNDQYTVWTPGKAKSWNYAAGINGAEGADGLLTNERGARLLYTQSGQFGDMAIHLDVNPEKTSAQGFGSPNGQYLEIYIKYNTATQTGYALRIERTTKYGFATDFTLYEYVNGVGKPISNSVSTTAFNPTGSVDLWVENNVLYAKATTTSAQSSDQIQAGLPNDVSLSATVTGNVYGGMGIQHTGTVSSGNKTQLKALSISYSNVGDPSTANLSSLSVDQGILTPAFSPDVTSYAVNTVNSVTYLTFNYGFSVPGSSLKVNGVTVTDSIYSYGLSLQVGSTPVTFEVTSPDGAQKTYTVTVTRAYRENRGNGNNGNSGGSSTTPAASDGTAATTTEVRSVDGKQLAQVSVDFAAIERLLESIDSSGVVKLTVETTDKPDQAIVSISADALQKLVGDGKATAIVMDSQLGSYVLLTKQLQLLDWASKLNVSSDQLSLNIIIAKNAAISQQAELEGNKVLGAVNFSVQVVTADNRTLEISDFSQYVPRTMKLDAAVSSTDGLAVVRVSADTNNKLVYEPVPFVVNGSIVTIYSRTNSTYLLAGNHAAFADISAHWAKKDIESMAGKRIVDGLMPTQFAPDQAVTRAEFAALVVRTLGLKLTAETKNGFKDIQSADWYQTYVSTAAEAGIVTGYDDQSFRPKQTISRQEMAVMIYRAMSFADILKTGTNTSVKQFSDADKFKPWAMEAISSMTAQRIIEGVAMGTFDPDATATRAQSAVILNRMLNQLLLTNAK